MSEQRLTLSILEQHLAALQEIEAEISPEQEDEFQLALSEALLEAVEKRDRVAHVVLELMRQASVASDMADSYEPIVSRLHAREKRFRAAADRLSWYVLAVMQQILPKPPKGPRKLEGMICTLKANGVPPSVEVLDESQVPLEYKRVTVQMSADDWEVLTDLMYEHLREVSFKRIANAKVSYGIDRTALLEALKKPCLLCAGKGFLNSDGTTNDAFKGSDQDPVITCTACQGTRQQQIPGARLETDKLRLVIE